MTTKTATVLNANEFLKAVHAVVVAQRATGNERDYEALSVLVWYDPGVRAVCRVLQRCGSKAVLCRIAMLPCRLI